MTEPLDDLVETAEAVPDVPHAIRFEDFLFKDDLRDILGVLVGEIELLDFRVVSQRLDVEYLRLFGPHDSDMVLVKATAFYE
jgi:hypothetical protein